MSTASTPETPTPIADQRRARQESLPAEGAMEVLFSDDKFRYYRFDHACMPDMAAMVTLINDAWMHDYGASGQAVFKYDEAYLRWIMQKNTFDGMWVTTVDGVPAGMMVLSRRTVATKQGSIPAHFGSLFSIATPFRRAGIGRKLFGLYFYHLAGKTTALIGVMDGESGGKKVVDDFRDRDIARAGKSAALFSHLSKPYTLWAACANMETVLRYMPMPGLLGKLALNPLVRKLIEFRYQEPRAKDYTISLVDPFGAEHQAATATASFGPDASLLTHYGTAHTDVGGTYRIAFASGEHCELYYTVHKIVKAGLPDSLAGHIQFVDPATASKKQVLRALRIVTNELCRKGCVAVLHHHTKVVATWDLLRSFYLPSDRKICYYIGFQKDLAQPIELDGQLYFDLL